MPANPNAAGKGRQSTVGTDADSIMPLLFAAIGNPAVSFKKMAAMDSEGRTESSFEHKFRKWRQQARDLAEKFPEIAGPAPERTPKKPRAAPAKKSTNGEAKQTDVGDGHDGDAGEADAGGVKHSGDNLENEAVSRTRFSALKIADNIRLLPRALRPLFPPTAKRKRKPRRLQPPMETPKGARSAVPKTLMPTPTTKRPPERNPRSLRKVPRRWSRNPDQKTPSLRLPRTWWILSKERRRLSPRPIVGPKLSPRASLRLTTKRSLRLRK